MTDLRTHLEARLDESRAVVETIRASLDTVTEIAGTIINCLAADGTIFTAGNGGSAAQAMHLAEEFVGRYRADRRGLAANFLGADTTAMTCIANDLGFEEVFARPLAALADPGDIVIVLSTSGNSPNIVRALEAAGRVGCRRIGLLGGNGGQCLPLCDAAVVVSTDDSAHVQDAHQMVIHLLCEAVDSWAARTPA